MNSTTFFTTAAAFALLSPALADNIVPAGWKQSNSFNNTRLASNLSNSTGMSPDGTILYNLDGSPAGEPNSANGIEWMTSSKGDRAAALAAGRVWIVCDLGATYTLNSIRIWNFIWDNNGATAGDLNGRGVSQFDILVRNTAADTADGTAGGTPINVDNPNDDATNALNNDVIFNLGTANQWTMALENQSLPIAPNNDTYTGESFTMGGQTARFIAIRVDSYYGNAGGIGLGKVRIDGSAANDTDPPAIVTRLPADDATSVAIASNLVANFNESIQVGTGAITLRQTSDNTVVETFDAATSPRLTIAAGQLTIDPTASLTPGVEYYVQIDATAIRDLAGNFFPGIVDPDTTSWSFTADNVLPAITTTTPADDATNVAANSNLVANFSETIAAGTGAITLKRVSDNSVVESFDVATSPLLTWTPTRVTIDPADPLPAGVEYCVQIDATAIVDPSGNNYAGIADGDTVSWSFTTDSTPPVAVSLSPASPTMADPGTRLLIQFNEAVQVGTGAVTVYKSSDNSLVETIDVTVPWSVALNGRVAAIVRTVALTRGESYYVNIAAGAFLDTSGNASAAITGTSAWTFATKAAVPIVVENFSEATSGLNGTAADTFAAAIVTAGGSPTWRAGTGFLANGAVSGTNLGATLNLGSYINDAKGTAAGRFELTMTISECAGGWISLGFNPATAPSLTQNFTTSSGLATIIYRGQSGVVAPAVIGEIDMFGGINNTNVVDGPDMNTGFRTLTAVLDLTPAGGYDNAANFGTVRWSDSVLGPLGSYTYTTSLNFGSIQITQAATGTINALALYQPGTPANTFAAWISGFSVGGETGLHDDFDKDNLGNALENLLGTNPAEYSPGLTAVSSAGGNLSFRHTRNTAPASDLTGTYEWSSDLTSWQGSGVSSAGTTVTFGTPAVITPGEPDLVETTATVSGTPVSRVFVRYRASGN